MLGQKNVPQKKKGSSRCTPTSCNSDTKNFRTFELSGEVSTRGKTHYGTNNGTFF